MNLERPKFPSSFLRSLEKGVEARGWRALVPSWLILAIAFGFAFGYFVPASFWAIKHLDTAVMVYIGILTLNGLILVLSWNAFSQIHDSIGDINFGAYLISRGLLNNYIFYIQSVHVVQLLAIIISSSGLLLLLCSVEDITYDRVAFAAMVAGSSYAIKQASSAVTVMHDLIWQKAIFDRHVRGLAVETTITMGGEQANRRP